MNHFMDFDPFVIRERNEQIHSEVDSLRLMKRLRKNRKAHGSSELAALIKRGRLLVSGTRLAQ